MIEYWLTRLETSLTPMQIINKSLGYLIESQQNDSSSSSYTELQRMVTQLTQISSEWDSISINGRMLLIDSMLNTMGLEHGIND